MSLPNHTILDKLRKLRDDYTHTLPEKIIAIENLWRALLEKEWTSENLSTIHRHTHSLAGSGSTFGFEKISDSARTLDAEFKALLETIQVPGRETVTGIRQKLDVLKEACEAALTAKHPDDNGDFYTLFDLPASQMANTVYRIMVFEESSGGITQIMSQIENYSYEVTVHRLDSQTRCAEIKELIDQQQPRALVFSVENFTAETTKIITDINRIIAPSIPSIFISQKGDMQQRLEAVRCGSDAFFLHPFDITAFIDLLDNYCNKTNTEPYRVMIVDDSESLANAYSMFLQQADVKTLVVTDPLRACDYLCEFNPDLILLDMYMPQCSGPELAAVIRQQLTYASVPIVFLSAELDISKQLNAMRLGGDDFLTKPIQPAHLISAVKIRAERYRDLRAYMIRDSLTGLFNHSKIEEQLHIELSRAERSQHPLAYAMVDIDHFKSINDNYGHAAGDQVIKSLARLMQKTLRKTDVIGRYGGEEFAVLLYNANPEQAFDIMENLRTDFEKIEQLYDNQLFKVTFSCGIAFYPQLKHAKELHKCADDALYEAKKQGRNRVVLAENLQTSG